MKKLAAILACVLVLSMMPVSYTHLDVYKRQHQERYPFDRPCALSTGAIPFFRGFWEEMNDRKSIAQFFVSEK